MKILDRFSIFAVLFPSRAATRAVVRRWAAADERDPDLKRDIIRLGGVLALPAREFKDGVPVERPIDALKLAEERGRRAFAIELLSMMTIEHAEFLNMMEGSDDT